MLELYTYPGHLVVMNDASSVTVINKERSHQDKDPKRARKTPTGIDKTRERKQSSRQDNGLSPPTSRKEKTKKKRSSSTSGQKKLCASQTNECDVPREKKKKNTKKKKTRTVRQDAQDTCSTEETEDSSTVSKSLLMTMSGEMRNISNSKVSKSTRTKMKKKVSSHRDKQEDNIEDNEIHARIGRSTVKRIVSRSPSIKIHDDKHACIAEIKAPKTTSDRNTRKKKDKTKISHSTAKQKKSMDDVDLHNDNHDRINHSSTTTKTKKKKKTKTHDLDTKKSSTRKSTKIDGERKTTPKDKSHSGRKKTSEKKSKMNVPATIHAVQKGDNSMTASISVDTTPRATKKTHLSHSSKEKVSVASRKRKTSDKMGKKPMSESKRCAKDTKCLAAPLGSSSRQSSSSPRRVVNKAASEVTVRTFNSGSKKREARNRPRDKEKVKMGAAISRDPIIETYNLQQKSVHQCRSAADTLPESLKDTSGGCLSDATTSFAPPSSFVTVKKNALLPSSIRRWTQKLQSGRVVRRSGTTLSAQSSRFLSAQQFDDDLDVTIDFSISKSDSKLPSNVKSVWFDNKGAKHSKNAAMEMLFFVTDDEML